MITYLQTLLWARIDSSLSERKRKTVVPTELTRYRPHFCAEIGRSISADIWTKSILMF